MMKRCLVILAMVILLLTVQLSAQASLKDVELQTAEVNGVNIAWVDVGDPKGVPLLMVMGLGSSHKIWGDPFIDGLIQAGYRVILLDNRDVGGSQRFNDDGQPIIWWNLLKHAMGFSVSATYTLYDMAADSVALLDKLELESAHVVGASMGGMIAQIIATKYPSRVRSLTSIMSSTGAPHLPPMGQEDEDKIEEATEADEESIAKLNARGFYPAAIPRHIMAVIAAGDRSEEQQTISVKTLVIHGVDDRLLPLPHGEHTAEMIPNADFIAFEGMAHNIPAQVRAKLLARMFEHIKTADNLDTTPTTAKTLTSTH